MSILLSSIKKLPDSPGVYFFKKKTGITRTKDQILYIGKATSLRDRVRSYLAKDLMKTRSTLIADMVALADTIEHQKTDSVLEALILEAELIRKYKPHYNTKEKDDKSFIEVVITDEEYPVVMTMRKRDIEDARIRGLKIKHQFGPFSSGPVLREALKIVRRIFPYRDEKCKLKSKLGSTKACFNYQIGLCPGTCIVAVSKQEYAKTIRNIALFFHGKKGELMRKLKAEMKVLAKAMKFEEANKIKRQIFALEHIRDVSLIKKENIEELHNGDHCAKTLRIEAYDIAHMQGGSMTGVMVVVEEGLAKKSDYRMFKIRRKGINDIASLEEIITRRLMHLEWPLPDIVVTDGGIPQYNAAKKLFEAPNGDLGNKDHHCAIIGVVKNEKHQPERLIGDPVLIKRYQKDVLLANAEAHRFTLKYHRKLRSKNMFGI